MHNVQFGQQIFSAVLSRNTASRMESMCPYDCIQISAATRALLPDHRFRPTGVCALQGVGSGAGVLMWMDEGFQQARVRVEERIKSFGTGWRPRTMLGRLCMHGWIKRFLSLREFHHWWLLSMCEGKAAPAMYGTDDAQNVE